MASTSQGAALTEAHRQQQQQVRAAFLVEFLALWALLDSTRLDDTGPGWVRAVLPLVRRYRAESARVAAVYYDEFRQAEAVAAVSPRVVLPRRGGAPELSRPARAATPAAATPAAPSLAPDPAGGSGRPTGGARVRFDDSAFNLPDPRRARIDVPEIDWAREDRAVVVSLTVTGPVGQKSKAGRGKLLQVARDESFVAASGAASRHVLTGGRRSLLTLVENDTRAIGWIRVTDGDPCSWCALLAGRGPVYRTEQSAGFSAHDACACQAEPVYSRDTLWPGRAAEFRRLYREVTTGTTGRDSINAFRRAYEQRRRDGQRTNVA